MNILYLWFWKSKHKNSKYTKKIFKQAHDLPSIITASASGMKCNFLFNKNTTTKTHNTKIRSMYNIFRKL